MCIYIYIYRYVLHSLFIFMCCIHVCALCSSTSLAVLRRKACKVFSLNLGNRLLFFSLQHLSSSNGDKRMLGTDYTEASSGVWDMAGPLTDQGLCRK